MINASVILLMLISTDALKKNVTFTENDAPKKNLTFTYK